jgi:hypothetical protein
MTHIQVEKPAKSNQVAWLYADLDGAANGFDVGNVGVLTVP